MFEAGFPEPNQAKKQASKGSSNSTKEVKVPQFMPNLLVQFHGVDLIIAAEYYELEIVFSVPQPNRLLNGTATSADKFRGLEAVKMPLGRVNF